MVLWPGSRSMNCARTALVLVLAVAAARSAPFVPGQVVVPDTVLSLARLRRVALQVKEMPAVLRKGGLTADWVRTTWTEQLELVGFEVGPPGTEGVDVPTLSVVIQAGTDESVPRGVLCFQDVRFTQPLHVKRVGLVLSVPTWVRPLATLETEATLDRSIRANLDEVIRDFIADVAKANEHVGGGGSDR